MNCNPEDVPPCKFCTFYEDRLDQGGVPRCRSPFTCLAQDGYPEFTKKVSKRRFQ